MRSCIGAVAVAVLGLAVSGAATLVGDRMTFVPPPEARVEAFLRQLMARRAELALKYLSRDLRARMSPAALQRGLDAIELRIGEIEDVTAQTRSWDRRSAAARAELIASNRARMPLEFRLTWESGAWAIHDLPGALGPGTVSSQKPRDPPANHATHRSAKAFPPPLAEARASFGEARRSAFGAKAARYDACDPTRPTCPTSPTCPTCPTCPMVFRTAQATVRPASSMNGAHDDPRRVGSPSSIRHRCGASDIRSDATTGQSRCRRLEGT